MRQVQLRGEQIYYIYLMLQYRVFSDIGGGSIADAAAAAVIVVSPEKSGRSEFQG